MSVKYFFTSDLHFGHKLMAQLRGFDDVNGMNQRLIDDWNRVVGHDDFVYHLGDFAFFGWTKIVDILDQLKGRKIFIYGNHDQQLKKALNNRPDLQFADQPMTGIREVTIDGQLIILCHYPIWSWNKMIYGSWHLHGHLHSGLNKGMPDDSFKRLDVGVDNKHAKTFAAYNNSNYLTTPPPSFGPFDFDSITEYMATRTQPLV